MKLDQIDDNVFQWQHEDAEIRLKYIKNNDLESTILNGLANDDKDIAVRLAAIDQLKQQKSADDVEAEVYVKNLNHQLLQFESALGTGRIKQAQKLQLGISQKIRDTGVPKNLRSTFESYTAKLNELKDWQGYATLPKREALCQEMAGLAANESLPETKKAEHIKALQDQWKNLGASDGYQAQKLWRKFKKIGERAYEPCAKYFSVQKEIRSQNFREKEKICDELESLASKIEHSNNHWDTVDWKNFIELLSEAQKEWRRFDEISRKNYKRIQLRYKTILDILHGKINTERSANHKLRSDLVEKARQLSTQDLSISNKIEQIKILQGNWKEVGITERKIDQKLWKEFRRECDKIFELRQDISEEKKLNLLLDMESAKNIFTSLKALVESDNNISTKQIKKLQTSFGKATPIKPHDIKAWRHIHHDFQALVSKAKARIDAQAKMTKQTLMKELKRRAALCHAYEIGTLSLEKVEATWELESSLSVELSDKLRQRLYNSTPVDIEEKEIKEKERLCIRLEILADIESPEESQKAKLAYQVERLNKELSLGQKETRSVTEQISEIQIHWYCLSHHKGSEVLSQRFTEAESKLRV